MARPRGPRVGPKPAERSDYADETKHMPRMRLLSPSLTGNSCFVRRRCPKRRTLVISRTCACGMTRRRSRPELAGTRPTGLRTLAFSPSRQLSPSRNEPANAALRRTHKVKAGPTRLLCYGKRPVARPRPCLRFNPGARRIGNTKGCPEVTPRSGKRHVSTNQPRPIPPCSARVTPRVRRQRSREVPAPKSRHTPPEERKEKARGPGHGDAVQRSQGRVGVTAHQLDPTLPACQLQPAPQRCSGLHFHISGRG